ncbi:outer membrane beta-barrel protein [Undibacterium fentianense]|uniref:Outer membrane beta-barrel protein n=1 Tax=Undibacterium fentianense TaxID=2828728 RepID=A0A941E267_9BURK|nr:outer membrane beta-barrel protein [Undibacterium fentianense]MBR7799707.1 outer membrane beta-barrel protein [Undibacterium fentianense]
MLKKNVLAAAFVLGSAVLSAHAAAQTSYFGGAVGRAKWNFDCSGATSCHTAAGSWKLFGGYDFSPNFGVEGSYVFLNEVGATVAPLNATFNGRGIDLAGVARTAPINNFVGFAKLGVAFMKGEVVASVNGFNGGETHYSGQPLIGFGVMYQVDKKVAIRAEVDHRNVKVTGYPQTTSGVTNFTIGIQSEF